MKRFSLKRLVVSVCIIVSACPVVYSAQEYVITAANERLRFVPQGEKGYVVKQARRTAGISALAGAFFLEEGQISPIGGLDRHGIWIVENDGPASRNDAVMAEMLQSGAGEYVAPLFSSNGEMVAIIPEIVVRVRPDTNAAELQSLCESVGCRIKKRMEFTEQEYLLEVLGPDAEAVFAAVEKLGQGPEVEWACPNTAFRPRLCGQSVPNGHTSGEHLRLTAAGQTANNPGVFPNDPYFPQQWHLRNTGQSGGTPGADIRAPEAWEITTGDPNIVVAVIDTGVDTHHPDLVNNLVPGYDFWQDDNIPDPVRTWPLDAHGTTCAGLIAAEGNNGIGVTGVAYNCKVMPIRDGDATGWITRDQHATAFRWAAAHGADVISCSWGRLNAPVIRSAVQDVTKIGGIGREGKGCVVFFAVNISGKPIDTRDTSAYPEVISVGATDHNDVRWDYSGYGPELDLVAPSGHFSNLSKCPECAGFPPGPDVPLWTTDISGWGGMDVRNDDPNILDYVQWQWGTSASCPIAAGVAALVLSVNPNLTNLEVQRILMRSAKDLGDGGWDQYYGFGRVDAYAAVMMALNPAPIFVDDDGPSDPSPGDPTVSDPLEDGSSEHPFDSIQEGIDHAPPGETIVIRPGTYIGAGNKNLDFRGRAITVRSANGPANCIIDCQGSGHAFYFHSGEGPGSVVEGLTVTNGKGDYGGAISCTDSSPTINHCVFHNNSASLLGGVVHLSDSNVVLSNCTFSGNTAAFGGGAVYQMSGAMTLVNCILWGDSSPEIYSFAERHVQYCDVQGGFAGEGNINADPLFADPAGADYHLKSHAGRWDPKSRKWVKDDVTSPCIDAGDPDSDWTAELWPHGKRINMGVFGGTAQSSMSLSAAGNAADLNDDGVVDESDLLLLADKWLTAETPSAEDINRDGIVRLHDFAQLAENWLWRE